MQSTAGHGQQQARISEDDGGFSTRCHRETAGEMVLSLRGGGRDGQAATGNSHCAASALAEPSRRREQQYSLVAANIGASAVGRARRAVLLATANAAQLHETMRRQRWRYFYSFLTVGDSGCGIHAGSGCPNGRGQLEFPGGHKACRRIMSERIPALSSAELCASKCLHLENVRASLWSELTVPASTNARGASTEARRLWNALQHPTHVLAQRVQQFLRGAERHTLIRQQAR